MSLEMVVDIIIIIWNVFVNFGLVFIVYGLWLISVVYIGLCLIIIFFEGFWIDYLNDLG